MVETYGNFISLVEEQLKRHSEFHEEEASLFHHNRPVALLERKCVGVRQDDEYFLGASHDGIGKHIVTLTSIF